MKNEKGYINFSVSLCDETRRENKKIKYIYSSVHSFGERRVFVFVGFLVGTLFVCGKNKNKYYYFASFRFSVFESRITLSVERVTTYLLVYTAVKCFIR